MKAKEGLGERKDAEVKKRKQEEETKRREKEQLEKAEEGEEKRQQAQKPSSIPTPCPRMR